MALKVTVRNGAGAVTDITSRVRADLGLQLGNRAYRLESAQSTIVIDDDDGEYGNEEDLPVGLTMLSIAAHNIVTVSETATDPDTVLVRGRVIPKEIERGDKHQDRARTLTLRLDDYNADAKGMAFLQDYDRPEETDVARATWVYDTFLSGSPRSTTNLTSGIVAGDTVTMPAKTYEAGTQPYEVLNDCATAAEKEVFIMSDGTLYYGTTTDTSQRAGLDISDREDEIVTSQDDVDPASFTAHETIPTPNGGFENGNTDNWNGAVLTGPGSYAEGSQYCSTANTLDPQWRYTGWVGQTFNSGETYRFRFYVLGSGLHRVRIGDLNLDGSSPSGDYEEWTGSGNTLASNTWTAQTITWTPSANRTSVRLVHDKPGHGELGIDQVLLAATEQTLVFPPIPTGPASTENGQGLLSGGVLRHADGFVTETRSSVADDYDYWVELISDAGAVDATDATSRLGAILDVYQFEHRTYQVAVQLHRSQVHLLKAGQMIDIKWRAIPDADDQYRTRRIASLEWQWVGPEHWLAVMELDKPLLLGTHPGAGSVAAASVRAKAAEQQATGTRWEPVIWDGEIVYWNGDIVMHKVTI